MVDVIIGGNNIELSESFTLDVEFENPLFSDTGFKEGKSFTFNVPATPYNRSVITNKVMSFDLLVESIRIMTGEVHIKKQNQDVILLQYISNDTAERKKLDDTLLSDLEWETIDVCTGAAFAGKQALWKSLIDDNLDLSALDATQEKIVFPLIYSKGYRDIDYANKQLDDNVWMDFNENAINYVYENGFVGNTSYSVSDPRKIWATTVAPCVRIPFIISQIVEQLGYSMNINELDQVLEYQQMFEFNNRVLDKFEISGSLKLNNFADEIAIANHLPNANCLAVFQLLQEIFDAHFIFDKNRIRIELAINTLSRRIVNLSRYLIDIDVDEAEEVIAKKIIYPIDEKLKARKNYTAYPNNFIQPMKDIYWPAQSAGAEEVKLNHHPMYSGYGFQYGLLSTYLLLAQYEAGTLNEENRIGYGEFHGGVNCEGFVVSDEFPEEDTAIFENFRVGLYRGYATTLKQTPSTGNSYVDHPYTYSYRDLIGIGISGFSLPSFGISSIFNSGPYNSFDIYKSLKLQKSNGSLKKERVYALPAFELQKMLTFKHIRHVVEQQNESFIGYIKSVKFTVSKYGVGETRVVYLVDSKIDNLNNKRQWVTAK